MERQTKLQVVIKCIKQKTGRIEIQKAFPGLPREGFLIDFFDPVFFENPYLH